MSDGAHVGGDMPLIQSLVRADRILSAIAAAGPGGLGLTGIADTAEVNKSTAHHLIRTLISLGYVERAQNGRNYRIGLRPHHLIWRSHRLREMSAAYHDVLLRLCHRTGETVNLAVAHGHGALVLSSLEGPGVARVAPHTGNLWPLHATGCGKIVLAHMGDAQRQLAIAAPKARYTPATITDPDALAAEIYRIACQGVAEEVEEHEVGAACVAVPVYDATGLFCCTISVAAPIGRMDAARRRELAGLMARDIASGDAEAAKPSARGRRTASAGTFTP